MFFYFNYILKYLILIITFLYNNKICVLSSDGKYYLASFDPKKSGDCQKIREFYLYDMYSQKNK